VKQSEEIDYNIIKKGSSREMETLVYEAKHQPYFKKIQNLPMFFI
jgi:hypothetical protein